MSSDSLDDLFRARIDESGITPEAARHAYLAPLTKEKTAGLWKGAPKQSALLLTYPTPGGKRGDFYRVRLLGRPPGFETEKPLRYLQPPHSGVRAYLPRVSGTNWIELLGDPETPIIFTEGEIKALKATLDGFPTIGLGGVENWRSARDAAPLLDELSAILWEERSVYICYDSDIAVKPRVASAAQRLAAELAGRGAIVFDAGLPASTTAKVGLDDFLVARGPKALERHLKDAQPFASVEALHKFNDRFIFVRSSSNVYETAHRTSYEASKFTSAVEANSFFHIQTVNAKGEPKLEKRSTAADWIKWGHRRTVQRPDYLPGKTDLVTRAREGDLVLNLWQGWGCAPKKGNIEPFLRLFDFITSELTPDELVPVRKWFLQWLAYPLVHPGAKLYSAVAVWGSAPGTGKTLIGETLLKIYGTNGQLVEAETLEGGFNSWAKCKQFILGDEITGNDSRSHADRLKGLITGASIFINEKFEKPYNLPNTIQFYFTSNHPDAFFLDRDRRFLVMETPGMPLPEDFYTEYRRWKEAEGPGALFYHLLNNVDLSGFNPRGPAPSTFAKEVMVDVGKTDVGRFITTVMLDPSAASRQFGVPEVIDLFSPHELHRFYDPRGEKRATVKAVSLELQKQGAAKILGGRQIPTEEGHFRYYAVRNLPKWRRATIGAVREYVAKRDLPAPKF